MPPLRINLLPAYIGEKKKKQGLIALFSVIVLASILGPLFWYTTVKNQVDTTNAEAEATEGRAARLDTLTSQASQERQQIAPLQDKVNFVEAVAFYNGWRQKIFRNAAKYTYSQVEYSSMAVSGNTLTINAYANNVDDLGRYLITFFGNPDVEAVSISNPPGWNPQQQQPIQVGQARPRTGFPFTVTARLLKAVQAPALPASLGVGGGAGAPGGAPPGFGGPPPGFEGGPPPGFEGGPPPDAAAPPDR